MFYMITFFESCVCLAALENDTAACRKSFNDKLLFINSEIQDRPLNPNLIISRFANIDTGLQAFIEVGHPK